MKKLISPSRRARIVRRRLNQPQPASKRPLWSLQEGWNEFRWLPAWENTNQCYIEVPHHFGVGPLKRGLVCGTYRITPCYPCEYITYLRLSASLRDRQLAQRMQPVVRIFMNVLDLQRPGDGVKVLGISQSLLDEIRMSLWDVTLRDLTHPERGHTIRVRKVLDGTKIRYTDIQISPTPTPIPYRRWRAEMERLDDYLRVLTYQQQQDVVEGRLDSQDVTSITFVR
jgi:hypothetical protein